MLDVAYGSFIFGAEIRMEFLKVSWIPESLSGSVVCILCVCCVCSLSVTCQVAMVDRST